MGFVLIGDILNKKHDPHELCAMCGFLLVFVPEKQVTVIVENIISGAISRQQLLSSVQP